MISPAGFGGEPFLEDLDSLDRTGFAICAFFSAGDGYESYARRLVDSCRKLGLPYSVWRAPVVHNSISLRGTSDLGYSKPSFIQHCLDRHAGAAVAYLDCDTLVMSRPDAFFTAQEGQVDFCIYNWLSDPANEAYLPANGKLASPDPRSSLYVFSHRVDWSSTSQLNCSGVTQFYSNSPAARHLLATWQMAIANNPRSADDQCLNFAFNNPMPGTPPIRCQWLGKSYARCPFWPHIAPVILHPAIPAAGQPFAPIRDPSGRPGIHLDQCTKNDSPTIFPRDGGVDTTNGITFRLDSQSRPQPVGRYGGRFWIYGENPADLLH